MCLCQVAVTVDKDGVAHYKWSNRSVFNKRGTVYSIPKMKGGRNSKDLKLRADQISNKKRWAHKEKRDKRDDFMVIACL